MCTSCNKYLSKNKVPPCALVNGVQFPSKPAFFDLNELECRLLAPRLAFQKLNMQAPRGDNLKLMATLLMYQQMLILLLACYQGYHMKMEQSMST